MKQMGIAGVAALALIAGAVFGVHEFDSHSSKAASSLVGGVRGSLQSVSGSTLIVKSDRDSSAINVSTDGSTKFLEASTGALSDVKDGDYVSVGGAADTSGNVTATSITDSGSTNAFTGGFEGPVGDGATMGQVTAINGSTITVKTFANSVSATTSDSTKVQTLKSTDINGLAVGDALTVQGATSAGAVTARLVISGLTTTAEPRPTA